MPRSYPTAEQALNGLMPTLNDLPREMNRDPAIPPPRMVPEAHALYLVCEKHEDRLVAVGVQRKLIQSLQERAQAVSGAQAELDNVRGRKRTTAELEYERKGVQLRSDIVAAGRYALRTNDKAQSTLDLIQEGTGLDDLVQDFPALGVFLTTYSDDFVRIGLDPVALKKQCDELAANLQKVVVARRAGDDEEATALLTRNRACSYLWDAMTEIRAAGVYAFRNDPDVQPHFRSAYRARHRTAKPETPDGPANPNPTG